MENEAIVKSCVYMSTTQGVAMQRQNSVITHL